jgi:hypothetical protein
MAEFFHGRRLRYEIHVMIEGRWQIETVIADERDEKGRFDRLDFEEIERNVTGQANSLLATAKYQAVKVLRERMREDGFATTAEIFRKEATPPSDAPLSVGRWDGAVEPCTGADDLTRRPACRIMGVVLRGFLDRLMLTSLELLHHAPYIRKLNDNYSLVQASVNHIAGLQKPGSPKERIATLQRIVDLAEKRARDAMAERRLPVLDDDHLEKLAARIDARCGEANRRFFMNVALTRRLQGMQSYQGKLEIVLALMVRPLTEEFQSFVDEWAAGCFDSSQLVTDLLGRQQNLASALLALADLASGRFTASGEAASITNILSPALRDGKLPMVAETLWDRLVREIRRGKPLSRNDERREWSTLMQLGEKLPASAPAPWADAIRAGLKARVQRHQEADVA